MPLNRKSATRTARKRCTTCGTIGWYRPKTGHCHVRKFGPTSYCCWGPLVDAPIRRRAGRAVDTIISDDLHDLRRRGAEHRRRAERKLDQTRVRMTTTKQKIARLRRLLVRQQRDERKWTTEAVLSDAQLDARRQRAQHAARVSAQVQKVRRRLRSAAGAPDDEQTPPIAFVRRQQRTRRAA